MAKMFKVCLIFAIFCLQTVWPMHVVPEHTRNHLVDALEMKQQHAKPQTMAYDKPSLRQQSVKYLISSDGTMATDTDTDTTTATATNSQSQINAMLAKTSQLRHHTSYDKNDDVVVSMHNNYNDENENIFENLEAQPNSEAHDAQVHTRQRRELSDWLIAPNTRWCGRGNTANGTYNHLGGASSADKCCRKHDHCKVYISAMSNRYGLFNYRPYTLSHCSCDRRFRTCLKMANDEDAKTIGQLFFNMVQTQCFTLSKQRVCLQRAADGTCAEEHIKKKADLRNNKKF